LPTVALSGIHRCIEPIFLHIRNCLNMLWVLGIAWG
jgi:hypothetical protein